MPTIEDVRMCLRLDGAGVRSFWRSEDGQDLIEYSLLLAFVCLSGAAAFLGMGQTTRGLWSIVNNRLAAANAINNVS
ncbi:MAG: hypothetical protein ABL967_00010 [Bryobacteraceae bacterium]